MRNNGSPRSQRSARAALQAPSPGTAGSAQTFTGGGSSARLRTVPPAIEAAGGGGPGAGRESAGAKGWRACEERGRRAAWRRRPRPRRSGPTLTDPLAARVIDGRSPCDHRSCGQAAAAPRSEPRAAPRDPAGPSGGGRGLSGAPDLGGPSVMEGGSNLSAMRSGSATSRDGTAAWPGGLCSPRCARLAGAVVCRLPDTVIAMPPSYGRGLFCSSP